MDFAKLARDALESGDATRILKAQGISLSSVGRSLGCSTRLVSGWINGDRNLTERFADAFGRLLFSIQAEEKARKRALAIHAAPCPACRVRDPRAPYSTLPHSCIREDNPGMHSMGDYGPVRIDGEVWASQ